MKSLISVNNACPTTLPLLTHSPGSPLARWSARRFDRDDFLVQVQQLAASLPEKNYAINLCDSRYLFILAFAAALVRGQTNLMPCSRVEQSVRDVRGAYPDSYALRDDDVQSVLRDSPLALSNASLTVPPIAADHIATVAFTSGSTGSPKPNPKTWASLVCNAELAKRRFNISPRSAVIATVPAQHMYGLEASVLTPLIAGAQVDGGRPFFPDDLLDALSRFAHAERVLVTTPAHLKIFLDSTLAWPRLALIISATAPLTDALAAQAERRFGAPVMEIYGCTEGGSLASRRTLDGPTWRGYDGVTLRHTDTGCVAEGGHLHAPAPIGDVIDIDPDNASRFRLLGRHEDMINLAGKRESLANLNFHLNAIDGVSDGVFLMPPSASRRLVAFVVAPYLDERAIFKALAKRIDPLFLPRPLYKIERLPRNDTGKLPRAELLALLDRLRAQHKTADG